MDRISSSFDLPLGVAARWARTAGRTTVLVTGELDLATVEALSATILDATEVGDHLVLDLSGVTFCGAAGVDMLVELREAVTASGGRVTLRNPASIVRRVLAITRTAEAFEIDPRRPGPDGGT